MKLPMKIMVYIILTSMSVNHITYAGEKSRDAKETIGDNVQLLIPMMGLASTLFYEDVKETHFSGTEQWLKAFLAFEIVTESLKTVTHKQRPNACSYRSFPSGHTAAAFMGSSFIHQRYGFRYAIPAYIGAIFVGYSRVQAHKHYGEDVMAGAAIGIMSSLIFTKPYKGVVIAPVLKKNTVGLEFSKQW